MPGWRMWLDGGQQDPTSKKTREQSTATRLAECKESGIMDTNPQEQGEGATNTQGLNTPPQIPSKPSSSCLKEPGGIGWHPLCQGADQE